MTATSLNDVIARIISDTAPIPEQQLAEARRASADGELLNMLLHKKLITEQAAGKVRERAKEIERCPTIANYTIIRKLGEGGTGAVYKAVHNVLSKKFVAMKVLSAHLSQDEAYVERFKREASSAGSLDHPNVVAAVDYGETTAGDPYFAMEYIDGQSVKAVLAEKEKLQVGDALKIIYDVALALRHAAGTRMVHRDIKPDNIMITRKEGTVKLADLGLAKQMDDENSMTQTGSGFGTPYYMPPEQARNAKYVDARSDIYALGGTLYHMLTGKLPFSGVTAQEVFFAKEKGTFPKPSASNPDVPASVNLLVDKMMAKEPAHRFQSADELLSQLDKLGLHNDRLSFIGGDGAQNSKATRPTGGQPKVHANPPPRNNAAAPKGAVSQPAQKSASSPPADLYYLRYKDLKGNPVHTKMPKSRVLHMIKNNQLDETVEVATSPKGPFRRLAAYSEFEPFVRSKAAARKMEKKTAGKVNSLAGLIENFDRDQSRHKMKRSLKAAGWALWSLIVAGALFVAGCWGIYTYLILPALDKNAAAQKELERETKANKQSMGS